jgi:hypothetical protein
MFKRQFFSFSTRIGSDSVGVGSHEFEEDAGLTVSWVAASNFLNLDGLFPLTPALSIGERESRRAFTVAYRGGRIRSPLMRPN